MRVEVLLVKGAVAQHAVNGEAVGIRGEALLGDELLDYKVTTDRESLGVLYRGEERAGRIHARDALTAGESTGFTIIGQLKPAESESASAGSV